MLQLIKGYGCIYDVFNLLNEYVEVVIVAVDYFLNFIAYDIVYIILITLKKNVGMELMDHNQYSVSCLPYWLAFLTGLTDISKHSFIIITIFGQWV